MITMNGKYLFHVHTYRCYHAENIPDEVYIKRAIELGADSIWFSDHAPFPGNLFENRMAYEQLSEYLSTLHNLKVQYEDQIDIHIGLEIEYFPSFDESGYYYRLKSLSYLEFLLLGQHMAELKRCDGVYTFNMPNEWLDKNEFKVLGMAEIYGISSGYFDYVAHPDRIFRRCKKWTKEMQNITEEIVETAANKNIPLEQNEASKKQKGQYWPEFWKYADNKTDIVHGLDAHAVNALELIGE